jgi:hypothetical protein
VGAAPTAPGHFPLPTGYAGTPRKRERATEYRGSSKPPNENPGLRPGLTSQEFARSQKYNRRLLPILLDARGAQSGEAMASIEACQDRNSSVVKV